MPVDQLTYRGYNPTTTGHLGITVNEVWLMDKTAKKYLVLLDPYGRELREVDAFALGRASDRARHALYNAGIEPELNDLLPTKGPDDLIPVEVWWRAAAPGPTYREVNQPMVEKLRTAGITAHLDDRLPFGRASVAKKRIPEVLAVENVIFIGRQEVK